jgi:hypothetical protein
MLVVDLIIKGSNIGVSMEEHLPKVSAKQSDRQLQLSEKQQSVVGVDLQVHLVVPVVVLTRVVADR